MFTLTEIKMLLRKNPDILYNFALSALPLVPCRLVTF